MPAFFTSAPNPYYLVPEIITGMATSFLQVTVCLLTGIVIIILLTVRYRVHAFFALLIACFIMGLGVQMPVEDIINSMKEGFGSIMRSLGLLIVLGTTLGVLLEHTGSTKVMAASILNIVGEKHAALAMSITGFVVGLPIFCDSGFIVLSGLNRSIANRTGTSVVITSVSLATGLYAVHCLIPPHPGASSAAVSLGVDFGKLILMGIVVALPAMITGYCWAVYAGRKMSSTVASTKSTDHTMPGSPTAVRAFFPVMIPIILITLRSFLVIEGTPVTGWHRIFYTAGDPVIALSIGLLLAFNCGSSRKINRVSGLLEEAAEKAGGILVIIGAGGAFGAVLAATKIGEQFGKALPLNSLGILFPFLLTFILKTAQGSSTVAIITAASIVSPLLSALGLQTDTGRLLCVLSMGAGSMMISHANDAFFWVIAKFSGLDMGTMLRVYSVATLLMGLTTFLMVYLLSLIM